MINNNDDSHDAGIDWSAIMHVSDADYVAFTAEQLKERVEDMWMLIVQDPKRDNRDVMSIWYQTIERHPKMKRSFLNWAMQQRSSDEDSRPISWQEVFQFVNHLRYQYELYSCVLAEETTM